MAGNRRAAQSHQFGWPQMLRDVFVASLNRGQFLLAIVGFVISIMILKMPGPDVSTLVFRLEAAIESGKILGYVLAVALAMGWFWHSRYQRRMITQEMRRIGEQRTKVQADALGKGKVKSSERRP